MPLFQSSVITKHLQNQNKENIAVKWESFKNHFHNPKVQEEIKSLKEEQYQGEFLEDFFVKILGYTKPASSSETKFNLTTEYKNIKDSKKADGAIIINDAVKAVIELKGTNTTDLGKIEVQAFGYKNNQPECTYVITSNFEKLRFYIDNAIEHIEFNLFTLTEKDFNLLYLCLAYENIEKDIPKKIKEQSISQEDAITKKLYNDYSLFKRELHQNLVALNPQFDALELFQKSQKLLDRFLFLFFAEDRQLLPPNSVRLVLSDWRDLQERDAEIPLYNRFKKYFEYLNTGFKGKRYDVFAYNGGLFKPDEILDSIKIDDELLYKHTINLSQYDFDSEVDVNILGHIFENSLNELDEIKAQLAGEAVDKTKTKRKKDGVFYTPKYITKYIVENTVGKLCVDKKSELEITEDDYITNQKRQKKTIKILLDKLTAYRNWLLQLTICDPACGSGAFLNQALDFLINEHKYIDELQAKLFGDAMVLSDVEKSILENNLFGVDLNEESVEIAKLSLWLRTAQPNRKLNDLNNNLKCGNSLIDDVSVAGDKAFNWQQEFPQIFKEKNKKAFHITTAVHDSRTSERMIEFKVREKRDLGTNPYPNINYFTEEDEFVITQTIANIVKEDNLNVLAYNICADHIHLLLVCEEENVPTIMQRIKGKTARVYNRNKGINPLVQKENEKSVHLWTQKFGCKEITKEEHLFTAIDYIKHNRSKHNLPQHNNKGFKPLVESIICSYDHAFRQEYKGGFDVVIGNPPYGAKLTFDIKEQLSLNYSCYKDNYDIYSAFIQLAFQLNKSNGIWGFINPVSWQSGEKYLNVRQYLANNGKLEIGIKLPYDIFDDAYVDTGIYIIRNIKSINYSSLVFEFSPKFKYYGDLITDIELKVLPSAYWANLESMKIVLNPSFYELLPRVFKDTIPLNNISDSIRGILPNIEDVSEIPNPEDKKYFVGGLYRYEIIRDFKSVNYGDHLKEKPKDFSFFQGERILIRRLINRQFQIMAMYLNDEFVNKKDLYNLKIINNEFDIKFILALINSKLISYLKIKGTTTATKDDFGQLTLNDIRQIPIKKIKKELQAPLIKKSDTILSIKKELQETSQKFQRALEREFFDKGFKPLANTANSLPKKLQDWYLLSYGDFIKELEKKKVKLSLSQKAEWEDYFLQESKKALALKTDIDTTDKEIDQMVYALYGLTEEEIGIVENS